MAKVDIDRHRCIYCGACVAVCPVRALTLRETRVDVDESKCIQCASCEKACPAAAIKVQKK